MKTSVLPVVYIIMMESYLCSTDDIEPFDTHFTDGNSGCNKNWK